MSDKARSHASRLDSRPLNRNESNCVPVPAMSAKACPSKTGGATSLPGLERVRGGWVRKLRVAFLAGAGTLVYPVSGRSVAWLARLFRVQEVVSSNLTAPTTFKFLSDDRRKSNR